MKILIAAFLLCALCAHGDVIVLKNGDRVSGSVVKKDGDKVTIKSTHFGVVTLAWAEIETLTIDVPITAELASGQTVEGRIATTPQGLTIGGQTVALADVKALRDPAEQRAYQRLLHPGWAELWAGTATIGWAGTSGNAQTNTFTVGANATRATRTDKTAIYFNAIKSSARIGGTKQDTAQAVRGGVSYSRNLTKRIFANAFTDWEFDRFQALDLRAVFGGGIGYQVWKTDRNRFEIPVGIDYSHAKFDPAPLPKYTKNAAEFYWGDDFASKMTDRFSLVQSYRMFDNLSDTGEYRINFDLGASTRMFKWLSWNLSYSDRYLSNPAPGRRKNDQLYTTGFGVTFAR